MTNVFNLSNMTGVVNPPTVYSLDNYSMIDESFFLQALDFTNECTRDMNTERKKLYKTFLESNNNYKVIHEGFAEFFDAMKKIIDKILAHIKALFNRFITMMNGLVKSDKYLSKHHKDLYKFDNLKHSFEFLGYEYSFSPHIPVINALEAFEEGFIGLGSVSGLQAKVNDGDAKELAKYIRGKHDALTSDLNNNWYDVFRARVLGKEGSEITQSEYPDELFEIFRGGDHEKTRITVEKDIVDGCYSFFTHYKDMESDCKKTKGKIDDQYKAIKRSFEKMVSRNYDKSASRMSADLVLGGGTTLQGFALSDEVLTNIDEFAKSKVDQVEQMGAIHTTAFASKLDALKECYKQCKAVLYKALSKIHGTVYESVSNQVEDYFDYSTESALFDYKYERIGLQSDLNRYIQECLILSESAHPVNEIQSINENVKDTIKNGFQKIVDFVKKMWAKFVNMVDVGFKDEKEYLKKYKDIILKKKMKEATYTMRNYPEGVKRLVNAPTFPDLNYASMKNNLVDRETFDKFVCGKFGIKYDARDDFTVMVKNHFRGSADEIELSTNNIKMADLYDYCMDYKNIENKLKANLNVIDRAYNAAVSEVDKLQDTNTQIGNESSLFAIESVYSTVLESYITEADSPKVGRSDGANNSSGSKDNGGSSSGTVSRQMASNSDENIDTNAQQVKSDVQSDNNNQQTISDNEMTAVKDRMTVYMNTARDFLTSQMTVSEEIFKAYMKIIRMHVKDNIGNDQGDTTPQQPTNYKNNNNNQQQQDTNTKQKTGKVKEK